MKHMTAHLLHTILFIILAPILTAYVLFDILVYGGEL